MNQLGINPLLTAFPWIFNSFVGYLEISEIFLLWDRVIGFGSVELIAVLAAALFVYRSNLILNCTSQEEFDELFYDLSEIKVVPLLQHFIFVAGYN